MRGENLDSLEIEDKVIIKDNRPYADTVHSIKRLTKTQIILDNDEKFKRDSGRQVGGDDWNISYIYVATKEIIAKIEHIQEKRKLVNMLRNVRWEKYSLPSLTAIVMSLSDNKKEKK